MRKFGKYERHWAWFHRGYVEMVGGEGFEPPTFSV